MKQILHPFFPFKSEWIRSWPSVDVSGGAKLARDKTSLSSRR